MGAGMAGMTHEKSKATSMKKICVCVAVGGVVFLPSPTRQIWVQGGLLSFGLCGSKPVLWGCAEGLGAGIACG